MIAVGSCNADVSTILLTVLLERSEAELKDHFAKFIALASGLLFLSKKSSIRFIVVFQFDFHLFQFQAKVKQSNPCLNH